jgi:hypothetical protein
MAQKAQREQKAEQKKAERQDQKPRKAASGEWMYCTISARPEEIAKWRELAGSVDRSLSWWIRDQLNRAVEIMQRIKDGGSDENQTLEVVPADRPVDHPDRG